MQTVTIDLIPQDVLPIIKVSQFNDNWDIKFIITENGEEVQIRTDDVCTCVIRKPDNNIVTITATTLYDNGFKISLTEQACACYGKSIGELVIIGSVGGITKRVGTCNFILDVEISPEFGGIVSQSEIDNLQTQVEEIVTEVLSDDYYTKTETDELLDAKANASDVYTKTQADTLLNAKANASDVYTKTQTDTLLNAKANASDVYTKTEVDTLIDNIFPTRTASGAIAKFITALTKPLVSATVDPLATKITRCGVNLWKLSDDTKNDGDRVTIDYINNGIKLTANDLYARASYVYKVKAGQTYTLSYYGYGTGNFIQVYYNDAITWNPQNYGRQLLTSTRTKYTKTITATSDILFVGFYVTSTGNSGDMFIEDFMLEVGSSASDDFHAYNGQTMPVSDATTLDTLSGVNNVFADVGDVSVQYKYMSI